MFEMLDWLREAHQEILHLSELTGLSVGLILGLAAIAYFDPVIRKLVVRVGAGVLLAYVVVIYGYRLGASDIRTQWKAANLAAEAAAAARDILIQKQLEAKYPPASSTQVDEDERKVLADLSAAPGACQLGTDALRLRH
jgi:hypothetical protein